MAAVSGADLGAGFAPGGRRWRGVQPAARCAASWTSFPALAPCDPGVARSWAAPSSSARSWRRRRERAPRCASGAEGPLVHSSPGCIVVRSEATRPGTEGPGGSHLPAVASWSCAARSRCPGSAPSVGHRDRGPGGRAVDPRQPTRDQRPGPRAHSPRGVVVVRPRWRWPGVGARDAPRRDDGGGPRPTARAWRRHRRRPASPGGRPGPRGASTRGGMRRPTAPSTRVDGQALDRRGTGVREPGAAGRSDGGGHGRAPPPAGADRAGVGRRSRARSSGPSRRRSEGGSPAGDEHRRPDPGSTWNRRTELRGGPPGHSVGPARPRPACRRRPRHRRCSTRGTSPHRGARGGSTWNQGRPPRCRAQVRAAGWSRASTAVGRIASRVAARGDSGGVPRGTPARPVPARAASSLCASTRSTR